MAAPISFEFERTVGSSHQTGKSELSAGKLELIECLFERSPTSASTPTPYSTTQVAIFLGGGGGALEVGILNIVVSMKMTVIFLCSNFSVQRQIYGRGVGWGGVGGGRGVEHGPL